jgi:hypothetical protein
VKLALIDGEFPPIDRKNVKKGDFAWDNRKTSAYFARNELHSEINRKTSAYITFSCYLIKGHGVLLERVCKLITVLVLK